MRPSWIAVLLWIALVGAVPARDGRVQIHSIESPGPGVLEALVSDPGIDVRWVERGLVVYETTGDRAVLPGSRTLGERAADQELGLLRGPDTVSWKTAPLGVLDAEAGPVWIVVAQPRAWPVELLGCHGGLVRPGHDVDPTSLLDRGPPQTLLRALERPPRAGGVSSSVSEDTLRVYLALLSVDEVGEPADRFVYGDDLDQLYSPRTETVMRNAVSGIPGATVVRDSFVMDPDDPSSKATYNVIARLPGTEPGTGTFVVSAHIDATGSRDAGWVQDAGNGFPVRTPGAEDNGSGVACVLEVLRCLADPVRTGALVFAFDLEFVAFSGEEVATPFVGSGLVGSEHYVTRQTDSGVQLLGNLNLDMVGYEEVPSNLQIVHNTASRWMADWVEEALQTVEPPGPLQATQDLDESRSSDHNSFWRVNAPAVLLADAAVSVLRNYETYHMPSDTLGLVRTDKMADVSRVVLAALARFDQGAETEPRLALFPEEFGLWLTTGGGTIRYDPEFFRLWPGSVLEARFFVRSLGASYTGPVRVEIEKTNDTTTRLLYQEESTRSLPTGSRFEVVQGVPIEPQDGGAYVLRGRVEHEDTSGEPVVLVVTDSFLVGVQQTIRMTVHPNPVRGGLEQAKLTLELDRPGVLRIELYNLEGERLSTRTQNVVPPVLFVSADLDVDLVTTGLASGPYVVRALWTGDGGRRATGTTRLVLIR